MLNILLINDNKIVSRLLQLSSKKSGFDMEESGIFSPQKESYNLIFIDSDKYNPELIDKIKSSLTYDKLVFIGTNQVKKPEEFELILEKPFLPADFTQLVEENFITNTSDESKEDIIDEDEDEEIFDFDDDLNSFDDDLSTSPEKLSQMVDDIDEIDSEDDDLLNLDEQEIDIDDDLLSLDDEDSGEEVDIEEDLPNIDDELEEKDEQEIDLEKTEDISEKEEELEEEIDLENIENSTEEVIEDLVSDPLLSLDEKKLKKLVEPELVEDVVELDEKQDEPQEIEEIEEINEIEIDNSEKDLESIVKEQLKELITSDLIKEALKDMQLNITFSSKE